MYLLQSLVYGRVKKVTEELRSAIIEFASQMLGTCNNPGTYWEHYGYEDKFSTEFYELPLEALQLFDDHVMTCELCGWNVEYVDGCGLCEDCADSDEED
jgi:hypothetical protein